MCECSSRQGGNEKGVTQIEVTPEMIEAGFSVLSRSGIADEYLEADKPLLVEIFQAMLASMDRPACPRQASENL